MMLVLDLLPPSLVYEAAKDFAIKLVLFSIILSVVVSIILIIKKKKQKRDHGNKKEESQNKERDNP